MTDLAPLKLLAAGGSGGEKTYQYPETFGLSMIFLKNTIGNYQ